MVAVDDRGTLPTGMGPDDPLIAVPYVDGMLRTETVDAIVAAVGPFTPWRLEPGDPYAYARALIEWWGQGRTLIVIEQDIVPADGMIRTLAECPQDWCTQAYHVGEGRFTTGLGFCKISRRITAAWPDAANQAMRDAAGRDAHTDWRGVNEAIERKIMRHGYWAHEHPGRAEHLHYPGDGRDRT